MAPPLKAHLLPQNLQTQSQDSGPVRDQSKQAAHSFLPDGWTGSAADTKSLQSHQQAVVFPVALILHTETG